MAHRGGSESGKAVLFVVGAVAALMLAVPVSIWLSKAPADFTQAERLGAEIGCVCGTCPLRPIATCGCGFADGMLARLDQEIAAGHDDGHIMATFVADYGTTIKINPEASGVGLLAWLAPMAFLMVGAVAMSGIISHWRAQEVAANNPPAAGKKSGTTGTADDSDPYRDIVERELDALED
jgi:cytochrome c-type biogenesis protein CcmH/NrfF